MDVYGNGPASRSFVPLDHSTGILIDIRICIICIDYAYTLRSF